MRQAPFRERWGELLRDAVERGVGIGSLALPEAGAAVSDQARRMGLEVSHGLVERLAGLVGLPAVLQVHQLFELGEVSALLNGDLEHVGRRDGGGRRLDEVSGEVGRHIF